MKRVEKKLTEKYSWFRPKKKIGERNREDIVEKPERSSKT